MPKRIIGSWSERERVELVEKYLASSMNQKEFCDRHKIGLSTLQHWLSKYRRRHNSSADATQASEKEKGSINSFVPLIFRQSEPEHNNCQLEIEFPNRVIVRLKGEIDVQVAEERETISYSRSKKRVHKMPHGRHPLPAHLPRKDVVIEPEQDVSELKKIGEEITEELEYEPGKLYVKRYIRPKYALPNDDGVIIANLPRRPIEKGIAGAGLLSYVLVAKYVDHIPLYRQRQQFNRR